jgi:hypothetical protein
MAAGVVEYLERSGPPDARNRELVRERLDFSQYLESLEAVIDAARAGIA